MLDSPYDHVSLQGRRVGVFAGARASRYAERIASPGKHSVTGVGQNFIAAFVSHVLDLRGPSLVLDSACSSSLAAVHLACQSLQSGDSELAIAGGVDLLLDEKPYLFLSAAHALSPDGRCRTFDEKANGFVPGEGAGCVLLKPLAQAAGRRRSRLRRHRRERDQQRRPHPGHHHAGSGRAGGCDRAGPAESSRGAEHRVVHRGPRHRDDDRRSHRAAGVGARVREAILPRTAPSAASRPTSAICSRRRGLRASSRWRWRCITGLCRRLCTAIGSTRASSSSVRLRPARGGAAVGDRSGSAARRHQRVWFREDERARRVVGATRRGAAPR